MLGWQSAAIKKVTRGNRCWPILRSVASKLHQSLIHGQGRTALTLFHAPKGVSLCSGPSSSGCPFVLSSRGHARSRTYSTLSPLETEVGSSSHVSRLKSAALDQLKEALLGANTRPDSRMPPLSAREIKTLYRIVTSQSLLNELSEATFSSLVALFGSLSVLSTERLVPQWKDDELFGYHSLAFQMDARSTRLHWAFVLSVAKDKQALGYKLSASDNFWLMRAALEDVERQRQGGKATKRSITQSVSRARNYYILLLGSKFSWIPHIYYLEALFSLGNPKELEEIMMRLTNLMQWRNGLHHRLVLIMWRMLSLPAESVSEGAKLRFTHTLKKKIDKARQHGSMRNPPRADFSAAQNVRLSSQRRISSAHCDAVALRDVFIDVLFTSQHSTRPSLQHLADARPWAVYEASAAFGAFAQNAPGEKLDRLAQWNHLALLSMPAKEKETASSASPLPVAGIGSGVQPGQTVGWTLICILAALDSTFGGARTKNGSVISSSRGEVPEGLRDMVRTLWILWRNERSGAPRTSSVICCATVSFLRLATLTRDIELQQALTRHVSDAIVYPALLHDVPCARAALNAVAVQFAVMAAAGEMRTWREIFECLQEAGLYPMDGASAEWVNSLASDVLLQLIRHDTELMFTLYRSAGDQGIHLEAHTICSIGKSFVAGGQVEYAFSCLSSMRLPPDLQGELFGTLVGFVLHDRRHRLDSGVSERFAAFLTSAAKSLRSSESQDIGRLLLAFIRNGRHIQAAAIIRALQLSNPSLLNARFLNSFARMMLSSRRYRLLAQLFSLQQPRQTRMPLQHLPRFGFFHRGSALNISKRKFAGAIPFAVHEWPLLSRLLPVSPQHIWKNRKFTHLKVSQALSKKPPALSDWLIERAVLLMVRAGRISAALKFLATRSPVLSTKLGNIILEASLRPRRNRRPGRLVRHASRRLADLVKTKGFVPDRVTLNLLMKALLRVHQVSASGSAGLRRLFDQFVIGGYPGPVNGVGPFGVGKRSARMAFRLHSLSRGISFERHTRPLYRMFIRAFETTGDHEAAQTVRKLLRALRFQAVTEKARRSYFRRKGRLSRKPRTF